MKRQPTFITTLGLIVALSGLSPVLPVLAADAGGESVSRTKQLSPDKSQKFVLKQDQMDNVTAGIWMNRLAARQYARAFSVYMSCDSNYCRSNYEAEMAVLEALYWTDDPGDIQCFTC